MSASVADRFPSDLDRLANVADRRARRTLVLGSRDLQQPAFVERLADESTRRARVDLEQADRLAETARWLAGRLGDDYGRARALRAAGHVLSLRGRYLRALARYEAALGLFDRLGRDLDAAITRSGALQTLIYLGRYTEALAWARRARRTFARRGDRLRLARLDTNVGNVLYRQERLEEARRLYRRASQAFRRLHAAEDVAITLRNLAVCATTLGAFREAFRAYRDARAYCERHGLPRLVVEADYNIAYLCYLRGEYERALALYRSTRVLARELSDPYHEALSDLDQAEMYLELNLPREGAEMADQAWLAFERLKMAYEAAKAVTFLAIAQSQQGNTAESLGLFDEARRRFRLEGNRIWLALIDLYQALVLTNAGRSGEARAFARAARAAFLRSPLPAKAALSELVVARLDLRQGRPRAALGACRSALSRLARVESPALAFQAQVVLGEIHEALGDRRAAFAAARRAHARLERLRSHLGSEELKIAFLEDKLAVYETLVWMCLHGGARRHPVRALQYIEQAKSRSLADLIAVGGGALGTGHDTGARAGTGSVVPVSSPRPAGAAERVRALRASLDACYRQIDRQELGPEGPSSTQLARLRRRARDCEARLRGALARLGTADRELAALQAAHAVDLDDVRAALPSGTRLLQYYQARGTVYGCVIGRDTLEIRPLARAEDVRAALRLLQFQLARIQLGRNHAGAADVSGSATLAHLQVLDRSLVAPIRRQLDCAHLVIAPHGILHYLPFHALHDGDRYLLDRVPVSYAPSASVHHLCWIKPPVDSTRALIMGVPDAATPCIPAEIEAVAAAVPGARLFVGAEATVARLRAEGPESRIVHLATHAAFRRDNPMFSAIRLGDGQLSLFDLYGFRLPAGLVTLSGCGTGLNMVVGGDELVGLVRGLLYAGARAALVTLWDVNDRSTAEFMTRFYAELNEHGDKAVAVQRAMWDVRERYGHPYYWAPFVVIGRTRP